jgi:hypothetical protein
MTPRPRCAKPPVMTATNSLFVMSFTYGLTTSGASVWPTKMLLAAESDSAPLVPRVRVITQAMPRTTRCTSPRWKSTDMKAPKKMIVGST